MSSTPDPKESDAIEDEVISTDGTVISQAFRWSLLGLVVLGGVVFGVTTLLSDQAGEVEEIIERDPIVGPGRLVTVAEEQPPLPFVDITDAIGVSFVHDSGATGEKLLPETMVGGVAWFDMDGDQDPDLLLTGGRAWPWDNADREVRSLGLYRNDAGQFVDVTAGSGFPQDAYVMGPAIGDVDGDGDLDVFLSCLGQDRLLLNESGTFSEVPNAGGAAGSDEAWSSSSGFFDYDRDGDLDIFVCRYVQWSRSIDLELAFTLNGTDRAYGPPTNYQGAHCRLFENDGKGVFRDVSA
ncbi:MAG: FG-GAP-like repeat-containing protein, partial [Planctomycetota bacterium]|nr:FG-GAP-like repeat-containing protein [Planctomycetota bacterium]